MVQSFGAIIFMRAWIIIIEFVVCVRERGKFCRIDRNLKIRTGILHICDTDDLKFNAMVGETLMNC